MPPASPHLLILAAEDFGHAVAERIAGDFACSVMDTGEGTHCSVWPHADLVVLATSFERPMVAEHVDETAFAWKFPWFPVTMTARELRCGPVVRPGRTACHRCFQRRRDQHRPASRNGEPVTEPARSFAYPDHHVGVAAAFTRQAIAEALSDAEAPGFSASVRTFNGGDGGTNRSSVLAVDRCSRCRPAVPAHERWTRFATLRPQPRPTHTPHR